LQQQGDTLTTKVEYTIFKISFCQLYPSHNTTVSEKIVLKWKLPTKRRVRLLQKEIKRLGKNLFSLERSASVYLFHLTHTLTCGSDPFERDSRQTIVFGKKSQEFRKNTR
jgi:hypothetical protein